MDIDGMRKHHWILKQKRSRRRRTNKLYICARQPQSS